jgi:hypothetical protein
MPAIDVNQPSCLHDRLTLKQVIYSIHSRFLPPTHQRNQAAKNDVPPRCLTMKEWKEMSMQANGESVPRMSR